MSVTAEDGGLTEILVSYIGFFAKKKPTTNAILLILSIEEISLWPELSSPPRFRIQGGYPEHHGRRMKQDGNPFVLYWVKQSYFTNKFMNLDHTVFCNKSQSRLLHFLRNYTHQQNKRIINKPFPSISSLLSVSKFGRMQCSQGRHFHCEIDYEIFYCRFTPNKHKLFSNFGSCSVLNKDKNN